MIENMNVMSCEQTGGFLKLQIVMPILPEWRNSSGSIHGGALSTIIDIATSLAIAGLDDRNAVSVDLCVSFAGTAREGVLNIEAICHKVGKSLAFTSAEVSSNGSIIATGKHTKFMMINKWTE